MIPAVLELIIGALLFTSGPRAGSENGEFGGDVLANHSLDPEDCEELLEEANF